MANPITITNIQPVPALVGSTSRYANSTVIYYGTNNLMAFTTYKRGTYPFSANDKYMIISKTREYRPEQVSAEQYGTPSFWWKILEANNLKDVFDFQAGLNIRLPAIII